MVVRNASVANVKADIGPDGMPGITARGQGQAQDAAQAQSRDSGYGLAGLLSVCAVFALSALFRPFRAL